MYLKALSHYNVLANVCRRMHYVYLVRLYMLKSNSKSEEASLWTNAKRTQNEDRTYV